MMRIASAKSKLNLTLPQLHRLCDSRSSEGANLDGEPEIFESLVLPLEGKEAYGDLHGEIQAKEVLLAFAELHF